MKFQTPTTLSAALACLFMASMSPAQTTLLFQDDFNAANGTSLTNPASRAIGTLASTVEYEWTSTTDVVVDGTLNWDSNNTRNGLHQHTETGAGTTSQNFWIKNNWNNARNLLLG